MATVAGLHTAAHSSHLCGTVSIDSNRQCQHNTFSCSEGGLNREVAILMPLVSVIIRNRPSILAHPACQSAIQRSVHMPSLK